MTSVRVDCPAKTNLTLGVGEARGEWDGRHELDTIYCGVGVYDTIVAQESDAPTLRMEGDDTSSLANLGENNHAMKALAAMAEAAERDPNIALTLTKRIPVAAGLGGGSADAAAVILAVNELWELHWPINRLRTIAATLGADMPFCLTGGIAHGTGFGEQIHDIAEDSEEAQQLAAQGYTGEVIIGAYDTHVSTADVYRMFDDIGAKAGDANHLQAAAIALHPRSGEAIDAAQAAGASQAFVSGSGPSVLAFAPDEATIQAIAARWQESGAVDRTIRAKAPAKPTVSVTH